MLYGTNVAKGNGSETSGLAIDWPLMASMSSRTRPSKRLSSQFAACDWAAIACARLPALSTIAATEPDAAPNGGSNPLCARSTRKLRTDSHGWHNLRRGFLRIYAQTTRNSIQWFGAFVVQGWQKSKDVSRLERSLTADASRANLSAVVADRD